MEESTHEYLSRIGRKGGQVSGSRKSREHFVLMGKRSAEARNKKKLEAMKNEVTIDNKAE